MKKMIVSLMVLVAILALPVIAQEKKASGCKSCAESTVPAATATDKKAAPKASGCTSCAKSTATATDKKAAPKASGCTSCAKSTAPATEKKAAPKASGGCGGCSK